MNSDIVPSPFTEPLYIIIFTMSVISFMLGGIIRYNNSSIITNEKEIIININNDSTSNFYYCYSDY